MTYVAGSCNIGKAEIRQRQIVGLLGLIIAVVGFIALKVMEAPQSARLILIAPWMIFAIGTIQARRRFCLAYGWAGTFNFGRIGRVQKVDDAAFRAADRRTALSILGQSSLLGLALSAITYLLP